MAQTTANYGLFKPESTDTYNHLVYDNPNMDTIDGAMKDNADHAIDSATCIKSGTVHSVTRSNTSCPVFKFTATGDWNAGDTMNVDGTPVSVFLPNGTAPLSGCYVINTEVLASISGSRVTLYCPIIPDAANTSFDNTGTTLTGTNVQDALVELNDSDNITYGSTTVKAMLDKEIFNHYYNPNWATIHSFPVETKQRLGLILIDDGSISMFIQYSSGTINIANIHGQTITATVSGGFNILSIPNARGMLIMTC